MSDDPRLIALAKAGDRAAMNELLRRCIPMVRRIVYCALRSARTSFDVFDDACAAGLEVLWGCVPQWSADGRATLQTFVEKPIRRAAWKVARELGHAVKITYIDKRTKGPQAERSRAARLVCMMAAKHLEAPVYSGRGDGDLVLADTLPLPPQDENAAMDTRRVLAALTGEQAALLWRVNADGESRAAIAAENGENREMERKRYDRAMARARAVAGVQKAAA